jgi:hypothetical protein
MPSQFVEKVPCVRAAVRGSALAFQRGQFASKMDTTPLPILQRRQEGRQLTAAGDGGGQACDLTVDPCQLVAQRLLWAVHDIGARQ